MGDGAPGALIIEGKTKVIRHYADPAGVPEAAYVHVQSKDSISSGTPTPAADTDDPPTQPLTPSSIYWDGNSCD